VQQNATDAEYGHSAGGIVSVQMKSGSNEWHGSAYFFGRNPLLNARPDSTTPTPSLIRHNVWGATTGNPIIRNKVFNFFSYEGQNLREPVNVIRTLPTALEREGDFSKTLSFVRLLHLSRSMIPDHANQRQHRDGTPLPETSSRNDDGSTSSVSERRLGTNCPANATGINFRLTIARLKIRLHQPHRLEH
jgi:hypothetical protein